MSLLFNLLCQCHYNFALVWRMPLCTLEAVGGPPADVLEGAYIRIDKIALFFMVRLGAHLSEPLREFFLRPHSFPSG
jgi:hypothetical protein